MILDMNNTGNAQQWISSFQKAERNTSMIIVIGFFPASMCMHMCMQTCSLVTLGRCSFTLCVGPLCLVQGKPPRVWGVLVNWAQSRQRARISSGP